MENGDPMPLHRFETAEHPVDEAARLEIIKACGFNYAVPSPALDAIVAEASALFSAPIALISIVEEQVQRFLARVGLDASHTGRDVAFCAHALHATVPLIVPDATLDRRFAGNPLVVGPPHIRFYAGAPLIPRGGPALGTLCVIDTKPGEATPEQLSALVRLAGKAVEHIEKDMTS
jgi:GAF domain-containing protein